MMVTYKIGTGLVIARRADGTWSPPSAISTCGVGYGVQVSDLSSVLYPDMKLVYYYSQVLTGYGIFLSTLYLSGWR